MANYHLDRWKQIPRTRYVLTSLLMNGNAVITDWIGAVRQIFVILAIEFRDIEDLLIVTIFKAR